MSDVVDVFPELQKKDFRVLNAVERGMQHSEWVPEKEIPGLARLPEEETEYRLSRLNKLELLERNKAQYVGYRLNDTAYDSLALNAFVQRDSVTALGSIVNVGKESDIYKCRRSDREVVMKLHREGYTQFRDVNRQRAYTSDKRHLSWMYTARKAAEREHEVLTALYPDVSAPEPLDHNRHALVMELFEGLELSQSGVDKPKPVFDAVVNELSRAWSAGYVHSDMSEYNVLVSETDIRIIDWPQAVETEHPHADELLERDVGNLISYFTRKYPGIDLESRDSVVEYIRNREL